MRRKTTGYKNEIKILYIVKSIGTMERVRQICRLARKKYYQWNWLQGRIELGEARWVENDLAKREHEGENEKEYWLEQGKLGVELHERCKKCNKYVAVKIQVIEPNKWMLAESSRGDLDVFAKPCAWWFRTARKRNRLREKSGATKNVESERDKIVKC